MTKQLFTRRFFTNSIKAWKKAAKLNKSKNLTEFIEHTMNEKSLQIILKSKPKKNG